MMKVLERIVQYCMPGDIRSSDQPAAFQSHTSASEPRVNDKRSNHMRWLL